MKVREGFRFWVGALLLAVAGASCSPPASVPVSEAPVSGAPLPEAAEPAEVDESLPQPAEAGPPVEPTPEAAPAEGLPEPVPAWMTISLTDVRSGETFALGDFGGQVVVVETMAVWCPLCLDQAREIRQAHLRFGDEVVFISLDVDANESADFLREHAIRNGLGWRWAVAPRELARALADVFGMAVLNPPSTPVVILDRGQQPHLLRFGIKPATELIQEIEAYLA